MNYGLDLVILAGGAETVSVALAEAAWSHNLAYGVVALTRNSLLRDLPGCVEFREINAAEQTMDQAKTDLIDCLHALLAGSSVPVPVLPSEDDGLRLLMEGAADLPIQASFSHARRLRFGGLDKAELYEFAKASGFHSMLSPTLVLNCPDQLEEAIALFGEDLVVKPPMKPWGASLGKRGEKVIARRTPDESTTELEDRLRRAWSISGSPWLAQPRLQPLAGGERGVAVVRGNHIRAVELAERWKYPRMGGSAIWVEIADSSLVEAEVQVITEALDIVGISELAFLADESGRPRLLEINTRPWLQFELPEKSGFNIFSETLDALKGKPLPQGKPIAKKRGWLQLERVALSILTGDCGSRMSGIRRAAHAIQSRPIIPMYGSSLPGLRFRWFRRSLRKAFSLLIPRR